MDELEGCIAELLEQFPSYRILAVVSTAERAAQVEESFGSAVKAAVPCAALTAHIFDAIVSEIAPTEDIVDWVMNALPTRTVPGATIMYHLAGAA